MVRDALLKSVTWFRPPVSRHTRKLSTVPARRRPLARRSAAPSRLASSHSSLARAEVGVEPQAGGLCYARAPSLLFQLGAPSRRPPALPHDRVSQRSAGLGVPEEDGLSLVGDTDGREFLRLKLRVLEGRPAGAQL